MKFKSHAPRLFGLLVPLVLAACAQPRVEETAGGEPPGETASLTHQVATLERYAARMEEIYAAQEAEILQLRQEVAALKSSQ